MALLHDSAYGPQRVDEPPVLLAQPSAELVVVRPESGEQQFWPVQKLDLFDPLVAVHLRLFCDPQRQFRMTGAQDMLEIDRHDFVACPAQQGGDVTGTQPVVVDRKQRHENPHVNSRAGAPGQPDSKFGYRTG